MKVVPVEDHNHVETSSDSTQVPPQVQDKFEPEASAAVDWGAQIVSHTGKLG